MPLISLSYSRLQTFEQCEAKFEKLFVERSVSQTETEQTKYGERIHEAMENYGKAIGTDTDAAVAALDSFPSEAQAYLPLVQQIAERPGDKYYELKLSFTRQMTPCEWDAPDVWLRGILDVLVVNETAAYVLDWKTGKIRDDQTQLQMFAAMVFARFPQVKRVTTAFVWLQFNDVTIQTYVRDTAAYLWRGLEKRLERVQDAVNSGVFKAKPSALCRWCPAKHICKDARL